MIDFEQFIIDRITNFRLNLGLTQREIGSIIHSSASFIGNIENKKSTAKYNIKHICLLAAHFKLNPVYFFMSDTDYSKLEPGYRLNDLLASLKLQR